ncbi:hypothetical protein LOTGIDRAFT_216148 [Lottia gigantea]|uniref:PIH1 domain-containing protein 1 n=1 Tax=Lottia gigantea TaxID=225164 RepID=V4ADW5_LOTGI|nr:hypothetical protein LOTGIDRAFT_216148 [Lottia gigantea]ESO93320.1 hypothetical protein LOTGIDRAFT_216148 [Lottia gigantea]
MLEQEDTDQAQALLNRLLLDSNNGEDTDKLASELQINNKPFSTVIPSPGFCVKLKNKKDEKFFVNICTADNVPSPPDITDDELIKILESDDPTQFRIPMSIGAPHAELDKSGQGCTAYDVIVNPLFYNQLNSSELIKTFFLTVMLEGVELKYDQELSREWVILKNRKFVGDLAEQYVKDRSKSLITEVNQDCYCFVFFYRAPEPKFTILQEPVSGHPEFLVAEIHLPLVKSSQTLQLDLGEDRIVLETRSNVYDLDIFLPYYIQQDECGAQFDRKTKILTITMPVHPLST